MQMRAQLILLSAASAALFSTCKPLEPSGQPYVTMGADGEDVGQSSEQNSSEQKLLSLAEQATAILAVNCEGCHNKDSAAISAFDYVMQIEKMIDEKILIPGSLKNSRLYQRIADGTMPPKGARQLTKEEDKILREWIEKGTPISVVSEEEDVADREFVTRTAIFAAVVDDIKKIPAAQRKNIRYFTSTHLYNAGESNRAVEQAEAGLNKLINTFSKSTSLTRVQSIHRSGTIFRVNLSDYDITPNKWRSVDSFYPYHHVTHERSEHAFLQEQLETTLPILRIDWFLSAAGRPPIYYDMIGTPETLAGLQASLAVNFVQNIRNRKVIRAGFDNSTVSEHHRVIERHATNNGYLWLSYEFAEPTGLDHIFANPFGPQNAFTQQQTSRQFAPGGHELFYTLPNGMLAFAVYDFEGRRMHEAPALIQQDGKVVDKVVAGRTCHICHGNGPIFKEDQVRARKPSNLSSFEQTLINDLYATHAKFKQQIDSDSKVFAASMALLGISQNHADPIASVANSFEAPMNITRVAAELSLGMASFERAKQENPAIRGHLQACQLENEETFARACIERAFKELSLLSW